MVRPRSKPQYGATIDDSWRDANIGRLLFTAAHLFEHDLVEFLRERGYPEIRAVDLVLFRSLDTMGTRLTDLAARAAMTKQGMKELVDQAAKQGFVVRIQAQDDRRAKIVSFTDRGRAMLEMLHTGIVQAEQAMKTVVGVEQLDIVSIALGEYLAARNIISKIAAFQEEV